MATKRKTKLTAEDGKKAVAEAAKVDLESLEKGFENTPKAEREELLKAVAEEEARAATAHAKAEREKETAEMLARAAEKREADADPDVGVEVLHDFAFLDHDPSDCKPYLERAKQSHEPDKYHYRWVGTQQRNYNKRRVQGYEPVPGSITAGDKVLCRLPLEKKKVLDARIEHRKQLYSSGESAKFDNEVRRQGGSPFDGPRGPKDGLR